MYHNHKEKGVSDIDLDQILDGGMIEVLSRICPYEMKNGDENLEKIKNRLTPFE